jgi:predicted TPR repeat methyltransferase
VLGKAMCNVLPNLRIDGIDISSSMLDITRQLISAAGNKCYTTLYEADVTKDIPCVKDSYDLLVSTGTFTPGHLDCGHLLSFMPYLKQYGAAFVSVNKQHYIDMNFAEKISKVQSDGVIAGFAYREVEAWANKNYSMKAMLLFFVKM